MMYLTKPLVYALGIVEKLGGLTREQFRFLMLKEYPFRDPNMDIAHLLRMKIIAERSGGLYTCHAPNNSRMREAVGIMLARWDRNTIAFNGGIYGALLMFSKVIKNVRHDFYVCRAESLPELKLDSDNSATVIVMPGNKTIPAIKEDVLSNSKIRGCDCVIAVLDSFKYKFIKI